MEIKLHWKHRPSIRLVLTKSKKKIHFLHFFADDEAEVEDPDDVLSNFKAEKRKFKEVRKKQMKKGSEREAATLAMLAKFKSKLGEAKKKAEFDELEEGEARSEEEMEEDKDEDKDAGADITWWVDLDLESKYVVVGWPCSNRYYMMGWPCSSRYYMVGWPCSSRYYIVGWPCSSRFTWWVDLCSGRYYMENTNSHSDM